MSAGGGGDMNNGGGHPHAITGGGNHIPLTATEYQALLDWLKASHPHLYNLLTAK